MPLLPSSESFTWLRPVRSLVLTGAAGLVAPLMAVVPLTGGFQNPDGDAPLVLLDRAPLEEVIMAQIDQTRVLADRIRSGSRWHHRFRDPDVLEEQRLEALQPWNVWATGRLREVTDDREQLDGTSEYVELMVGVDHTGENGTVIGLELSIDSIEEDSFNDAVQSEGTGFTIGPYLGIRASDNWVVNLWAGWGHSEFDNTINTVESDYAADRLFANIAVSGVCRWGNFRLIPHIGLYLAHVSVEQHAYGQFAGVDRGNVNYVAGTISFEGVLGFGGRNADGSGSAFDLFAEVGLNHLLDRAGDGSYFGGDLQVNEAHDTAGLAGAGVRYRNSTHWLFEIGAQHSSLFVEDYDTIEFRGAAEYHF